METQGTDWTKARFEAIATLALNGLLANPENNNASPQDVAKRAIDYAKALDEQLAPHVEPVATQQQTT